MRRWPAVPTLMALALAYGHAAVGHVAAAAVFLVLAAAGLVLVVTGRDGGSPDRRH